MYFKSEINLLKIISGSGISAVWSCVPFVCCCQLLALAYILYVGLVKAQTALLQVVVDLVVQHGVQQIHDKSK